MKNVLEFQTKKSKKEKITMVTCYDYSFAKILNSTDIDTFLVGDSVAQVVHGHTNTLFMILQIKPGLQCLDKNK